MQKDHRSLNGFVAISHQIFECLQLQEHHDFDARHPVNVVKNITEEE